MNAEPPNGLRCYVFSWLTKKIGDEGSSSQLASQKSTDQLCDAVPLPVVARVHRFGALITALHEALPAHEYCGTRC